MTSITWATSTHEDTPIVARQIEATEAAIEALSKAVAEYPHEDLMLTCPKTQEEVPIFKGFKDHTRRLPSECALVLKETKVVAAQARLGKQTEKKVQGPSGHVFVLIGTSEFPELGATGTMHVRNLVDPQDPKQWPPNMTPVLNMSTLKQQMALGLAVDLTTKCHFSGDKNIVHQMEDGEDKTECVKGKQLDTETNEILQLWSRAGLELMKLGKFCAYNAFVELYHQEVNDVRSEGPSAIQGAVLSLASEIINARATDPAFLENIGLELPPKAKKSSAKRERGRTLLPPPELDLELPEHKHAMLYMLSKERSVQGRTPFAMPFKQSREGDPSVRAGFNLCGNRMETTLYPDDEKRQKAMKVLWRPLIENQKIKSARAKNEKVTPEYLKRPIMAIDPFYGEAANAMVQQGVAPTGPSTGNSKYPRPYVSVKDVTGIEVNISRNKNEPPTVLNLREQDAAMSGPNSPLRNGALVAMYYSINQSATTQYANLRSVQPMLSSQFVYRLGLPEGKQPVLDSVLSDMYKYMVAHRGGDGGTKERDQCAEDAALDGIDCQYGMDTKTDADADATTEDNTEDDHEVGKRQRVDDGVDSPQLMPEHSRGGVTEGHSVMDVTDEVA
jgi:hypothetical protein